MTNDQPRARVLSPASVIALSVVLVACSGPAQTIQSHGTTAGAGDRPEASENVAPPPTTAGPSPTGSSADAEDTTSTSPGSASCEERDSVTHQCRRCRVAIADRYVRQAQVDQASCTNMPPGSPVAVRARGFIVAYGGPLDDDLWVDVSLDAMRAPQVACHGDPAPAYPACGAASGHIGRHWMQFEIRTIVPPDGEVSGSLSIGQCATRTGSTTCGFHHEPGETVGQAQAAIWEIEVL